MKIIDTWCECCASIVYMYNMIYLVYHMVTFTDGMHIWLRFAYNTYPISGLPLCTEGGTGILICDCYLVSSILLIYIKSN